MIIHVYKEIKPALHHWNEANGSGPYGQFIGDGGMTGISRLPAAGLPF